MRSIRFLCTVAMYLTIAHALSQEENNLSAYDVLEQYDLPVGLLPRGSTGYELDRETGQFTAYLNGSCSFKIESYTLKYKPTVKGVISKGRLAKLKGVSVKVLITWLNIVEVTRDANDLQFSVGIASADFGVDNFLESPQCGCGFSCTNVNKNGDVSSI